MRIRIRLEILIFPGPLAEKPARQTVCRKKKKPAEAGLFPYILEKPTDRPPKIKPRTS